MQQSKLIDLLKTFSGQELQKLMEYVNTPFFNKNKKVRKLCAFVLEFAPNFEARDLDKKNVFAFIFGDRPFKDLQINNIISDLLQLAYEYLSLIQYKKRPHLQKQLLLEELQKRDTPVHFDRIARRLQTIIEQSDFRNHDHFHQEYLLYEKLDQSIVRHAKRSFDENLQFQSDNLDLYYFCNKLRIACDMTSRNIVIQAGYQSDFLEEIILHIENSPRIFSNYPAIRIYYKVLKMIQEDEESSYRELKSDLLEFQNQFPKLELWTLYKYVTNFCIKKINSGNSSYYEELLSIYKILLENEIIFPNGYLSQWTFKNIITIGIRLEAFDWTEQFIKQYESYLLPEDQFNAATYNRGALYSAAKKHQKALQILHNVEFTDSSYHLGAKIIQLKSYYELEETEALYALIEAFRKYILRNKDISDYRKKANNNMLKIAKGIYQLKVNGSGMNTSAYNQKRRTIERKLAKLNPIANKDWLEEILEQVIKKER